MSASRPSMTESAAVEWIDRCVVRLVALDPQMPHGEACDLAREMLRFQRTAAMTPEAAVDFAAAEMSQVQPRLERRSTQRD
jgi:hypothetical protein